MVTQFDDLILSPKAREFRPCLKVLKMIGEGRTGPEVFLNTYSFDKREQQIKRQEIKRVMNMFDFLKEEFKVEVALWVAERLRNGYFDNIMLEMMRFYGLEGQGIIVRKLESFDYYPYLDVWIMDGTGHIKKIKATQVSEDEFIYPIPDTTKAVIARTKKTFFVFFK